MKSFLFEVAQNIIQQKDDFQNICIVVPNRRTELFLKKEIVNSLNETSWLPQIITIKSIFESNSNLIVEDDLLLISKLFNVYKNCTGSNENFDNFYYWGQIILSDFDDVDKYLVDAEKLFASINDIQEIDAKFSSFDEKELEIIKRFWTNIDIDKPSSHKAEFLSLWSKMYDIYSEFRKILFEQGVAYQGMAYRDLVENIYNVNLEKDKYFIVGFNALNKCEIEVFKFLKTNRETAFFWDYDDYYVKNNEHEAGRFLRNNLKLFTNDLKSNNDKIKSQNLDVEVISLPTSVAQVKLIEEILTEWKAQPDFDIEKVAIALGDENLLIPLMTSIPDFVGDYNITMGFPLKNTKAFNFFSNLLSLRQNSRFLTDSLKFYHKDIVSILTQTYISEFFSKDAQEILEYINKEKSIYVDLSSFTQNEFLAKLFDANVKDVPEILNWLSEVIADVLDLVSKKEDFIFETEFLLKLSNSINLVSDCFIDGKIIIERKEILFKILLNAVKSVSLAFEGEPLKGMQVLGFLETRNLDFDRVIMLSLNEGVFPKKSAAQTLIPYNLRKFYELPSIEFQDSIFAYYFYRLLQRAKDVKILYAAQGDEKISGEVSRFVTQIKYEADFDIKFINKAYKISLSNENVLNVNKTPEVIEKIQTHLQNGISPSAINSYLSCEFKYFLRYVKGLKEVDEIEEKEDAALFGSLFHEIMKLLYEPYKNQVLNKELFKQIRADKNINKCKIEAIKKVFKVKSEVQIAETEKKLIVDVVEKYVKRMLDFDSQSPEFSIVDLEAEYSRDIKLANDFSVKIKGNIDRIDRQGKTLRVIDYKTGKVKNSFSEISELFEQDRTYELDIIMQLFLYTYILREKYDYVCPSVFSLNELNKDYDGSISMKREKLTDFSDDLLQAFEENLISLFESMLEPNTIFSQTTDSDNCKFCPYKGICNK